MLSAKEKKKEVLPSPRRMIRVHADSTTDDDNIDKTNELDDIAVEQVHTVNDWEHADLGDEQRKQKFLRLMGAKKHKKENATDGKDTHDMPAESAASSEKKHCRSKIENETIDRELEKQFNESLQSKILHTHHEGLGFCERESAPDESDHRPATKFVRGTTETGDSQHKSSR